MLSTCYSLLTSYRCSTVDAVSLSAACTQSQRVEPELIIRTQKSPPSSAFPCKERRWRGGSLRSTRQELCQEPTHTHSQRRSAHRQRHDSHHARQLPRPPHGDARGERQAGVTATARLAHAHGTNAAPSHGGHATVARGGHTSRGGRGGSRTAVTRGAAAVMQRPRGGHAAVMSRPYHTRRSPGHVLVTRRPRGGHTVATDLCSSRDEGKAMRRGECNGCRYWAGVESSSSRAHLRGPSCPARTWGARARRTAPP